MSLNQINLRGLSIDLELSYLGLSGSTTEFKHYRRTHAHIDIYIVYIFAKESVKICRFKTFWVRIFARGTLLLFRFSNIHVNGVCQNLSSQNIFSWNVCTETLFPFGYFSIHVKMCVSLTYSAIRWV